jgi:hypothetical protein
MRIRGPLWPPCNPPPRRVCPLLRRGGTASQAQPSAATHVPRPRLSAGKVGSYRDTARRWRRRPTIGAVAIANPSATCGRNKEGSGRAADGQF